MKFKTTLLITVLICWAICALILVSELKAAPFLTCDCSNPSDKIIGYQLQFGTQPAIDIPAVECSPVVVDGKRILYDLGTLPNGPFTVKALAKNLWGVSTWTNPLNDIKVVPSFPVLLRIVP